MKCFTILALMTLSSIALAQDWKVVAETENCSQKYQVLAKEGEDHVLVDLGERQEKLFSQDKSRFSAQNMSNTVFSSENFTFTQPSAVEANPPKLEVKHNSLKSSRCRMSVK